MEAFSLTFEEIDDALGGGWAGTLWGCAFEDFLTRRFGPEDENPVEAYLRRRGWKERAATRAYMTALQGSVMSLHEVSDILPGQSFRARDLVRGDDIFFCATGVTDGELVRGVHYYADSVSTQSIVMRSKSGTIRVVDSLHQLGKLRAYSAVDFDGN